MSSSSTRVYVGGLSSSVRSRDLEDLFYKYYCTRVDLKVGFGFVEFETRRDAEDAVRDMDGTRLDGKRLIVQFARGLRRDGPRDDRPRFGGGRRNSAYRLEVTGLSSRTSWQDLKDFGREAGNCTFADVLSDGTGVIEYGNEDDYRRAMRKLDETKLNGVYVRVRPIGRDGSRSRSRSPRDRNLRERSRSPRERSRSPRDRSRSPRDRSRSPRDRSRSPYRRRSYSPRRSYSRSPRRSVSPRQSPARDVRSPIGDKRNRSITPDNARRDYSPSPRDRESVRD